MGHSPPAAQRSLAVFTYANGLQLGHYFPESGAQLLRELNRTSRLQGRAFLTAVGRIFQSASSEPPPAIEFAHFAPAFGACLAQLNVPCGTALRLLVFSHLRGLLAAAIRLNIIGPMEAQKLQHQLSGLAEAVAQRGTSLTLNDLAQTAPLLDLWQGAQDRLYSRLFQT